MADITYDRILIAPQIRDKNTRNKITKEKNTGQCTPMTMLLGYNWSGMNLTFPSTSSVTIQNITFFQEQLYSYSSRTVDSPK
jgi:hypothetical protein